MNQFLKWTAMYIFVLCIKCDNIVVPPLKLPCSRQEIPCGKPAVQPVSPRIIGGQETQIGAWPWMVALLELGYFTCGGAIIHERVIMTAAHCFSNMSNDPSRWQVMAGKHNLLLVEAEQQVVKVKRIILHQNYDNSTLANDIALLVLDQALTFSAFIQPICLSSLEQGVNVGEMCLMAGWGKTKGTGDSNVLNQVALPIIADDVCSLHDWYWTDFIPEITFCAGYQSGGRDACKGDSGGALICRRSDTWFAQGVSSWGFQCAEKNYPGIYTNVSKYIDWITNMVVFDTLCGDVVG